MHSRLDALNNSSEENNGVKGKLTEHITEHHETKTLQHTKQGIREPQEASEVQTSFQSWGFCCALKLSSTCDNHTDLEK